MGSRILINNLTRLGDLLQSQALITALHEAGHAPFLLCQDTFAPAAALMQHLSGVAALPARDFSLQMEKTWQLPLHTLLSGADRILKEIRPDYIINLTPDNPSRLLTRLLARNNSRVLGFSMDNSGAGHNIGIWASFIAMGARKRHFTPFNLSDMFRRIGNPLIERFSGSSTLAQPTEAVMERARALITQNLDNIQPNGLIAFQLGASNDMRRWPVSHFAKLGDMLWEKASIMPILTGTGDETDLGREYAALAKHPFFSAIGKTDLPLLAGLLKNCKLLVTNDTGTMHIAAGIGTPVLAFFLATARPWDTGPALENCCCMEPNIACHPCEFVARCESSASCRKTVSAETAAELILHWLESGNWKREVSARAARESRIWITKKDNSGFLGLVPISGQEKDTETQWLFILREFWSQMLDNLDGIPHPPNDMPIRFSGFSQSIRQTLEEAILIVETLIKNGSTLASGPRARELFLKNCNRLQTTLDFCKPLASLGVFWQEFRHNQGADLSFFLSSLKTFSASFAALRNSLE